MRSILLMAVLSTACTTAANLSRPCRNLFASQPDIDALDQTYSVCPNDDGRVSMTNDVTPDINGIPGEEINDMAADDASYAVCRDLFSQKPFGTALDIIAVVLPGSGDRRRAAMEHAVSAAHWRWEPFSPPLTDGFTIYGCTDLDTRTIHLYKTSCETFAIYQIDVGTLNLGSRFHLVAAHEFGHVVDTLAGPLPFSNDPETRATVYGAFITQCHARLMQHTYRGLRTERTAVLSDAREEGQRQLALDCLDQKWRLVEKRVALLRRDPATGDAALSTAAVCAARASDSIVGVPRLSRCPTRGDAP